MEFRLLRPEEIEIRIGNTISTSKWQGYSLLLYKILIQISKLLQCETFG